MPLRRFDEHARVFVEIPDDAVCACCGRSHDNRNHYSRLCIDHIHRKGGDYRTQVLCVSCNSRKADYPYVSVSEDACWYPGMAIGSSVPKPPRGHRRILRGA